MIEVFNNNLNIRSSLDISMGLLRSKRQKLRIESQNKERKKEDKESDRIQDRYFDLLKNSTILTATVFGSSVALASGKSPNLLFITGELFLLISTMSGILFLWSQLRGLEWSHSFDIKNRLQTDMIVNKDLMSEFEKETTEQLIKDYEGLINNKGVSYHILKVIRIDWVPGLFYATLIIGLVFIWLSLCFS